SHITNFSWHDLRHTFASRLAMAGVDIRTIPGTARAPVARDDAALREPLAGPQARCRPPPGADTNRHHYRHQRHLSGFSRAPARRTNLPGHRRKAGVAAPWIEQGT